MDVNTILSTAAKYVGIVESPSNSNNVMFNTAYYGRAVSGDDYPWCCTFIWYLFNINGASDLFCGGTKVASSRVVLAYAKAHNQFAKDVYQPGDLVLFNFAGGSIPEHIGIVISGNSNGTINTIEGNTSNINQANGGEVMRKVRNTSSIVGAYRPQYTEDAATVTVEDDEVIEQKTASMFGKDITVDGILKDNRNFMSMDLLKQAGFVVNSVGSKPVVTIGTVNVSSNGVNKAISGIILNGKAYVAIADVMTFIGKTVTWNGATSSVNIA